MTQTPRANSLHIVLLGRRNSGKSSLVNALTGQDLALVSPTPGTTTDPVYKAMEIPGIGPVVWIDTPGFDDEGELGLKRVEKTRQALEKADLALLLCPPDLQEELQWIQWLEEMRIPVILLFNKTDEWAEGGKESSEKLKQILVQMEQQSGYKPLLVSAKEKYGLQEILHAIKRQLPDSTDQPDITGNRVTAGDLVLLVIPQDIQAPKGRLILPQVQTLRELLDKKCLVMSCTTDQLPATLAALAFPPKLIITDSQAFKTVHELKPATSSLTSFSVLFAEHKGDIQYFRQSATAIEQLQESSRVLIAEACTHAPESEDIGRVKLPAWLRKRVGEQLRIDIVSGNDFPEDLTPYNLIIHCGACMFNRPHVLRRVEKAKAQQVPMTNYGVAIAFLHGILNQID